MNTHHNGCPLVLAAVRAVGSVQTLDIFTTNLDELCQELTDTALSHFTDEEATRLRAFYIVEFIYYEVIPKQLFFFFSKENSPSSSASKLLESLYYDPRHIERTSEELLHIAQVLNTMRGRASAQATIYFLKKDRSNASLQIAGAMESVRDIIKLALEAVDILSSCLNQGGISRASRIGELLVLMLVKANYTSYDIEIELRTLLSINKQNAVRPWQKKKRSLG